MDSQAPELGRLALRKIGQRLQTELRDISQTALPREIENYLARLAELDHGFGQEHGSSGAHKA